MPSLNLNQNVLNGQASYAAGDWADAAGSSSLDVRLTGQFKRGINLEAGAGVMAQLQGSFHKFLSASVRGQVQASAQLRGQIQAPLDLFGEAGMAVRLQAVAEAAAMIELGIGLSIGDFLDLAKQDSRMHGPALKLLELFLEEVDIRAGVTGKAAFSAMAYANLSITGRLVPDRTDPPGFIIAAEAGLGLKAGAGYRLFAQLGLKDTRRLIRRSVDLAVDETIREVNRLLPDREQQVLLLSLRASAKMALRTGFELGLALADGSQTSANSAAGLSQRCVQVLLEEGQRFLMEHLAMFGAELFRLTLAEMGVDEATWNQAQPQRDSLAQKLQAVPAELFDLTQENAVYWTELANSSTNLALGLGGQEGASQPWMKPIAVLWGAAQLLLITVNRVGSAQARVSFLGGLASADAQAPAFSGSLPPESIPPVVVRQHINTALGRSQNQTIRQDDLVTFLLDDTILNGLVQMFPQVEPVLEIIAGPTNDSLVAAARVILNNASAFVQDNGSYSARRTLQVLQAGLLNYIDVRIENELRPFLIEAAVEQPDVQIYIDEVLLRTMRFTVEVAFQRVLDWDSSGLGYREALREVCSSIVMKLFGRTLVVSADVLLAYTQGAIRDQFLLAADHVDDAGGIAEFLARQIDLPNMSDAEEKAFLAEVLADTLKICADVYGPFPNQTRQRLRESLYGILDTLPEPFDDDWVEALKRDTFIPNARTLENMTALTQDLGSQLVEDLVRFFQLVLLRLAEKGLEYVQENFIAPIQAELERWVEALENLARAVTLRLLDLPGEIFALGQTALAASDAALGEIQALLELPSSTTTRTRFVADLQVLVVAQAKPLLPPIPFIEEGLRYSVSLLLDGTLVNPILNALTPAANGARSTLSKAREIVQDLLELNPQANLTQQLTNLFVGYIRDGIRATFGNRNPRFNISISHYLDPFSGELRQLNNPFTGEAVTVTLLDVEIPLNELVSTGEEILRGLSLFEDGLWALGEALREWILAEMEQEQAEAEMAQLETQQAALQAQLVETERSNFRITVLEPLQAAESNGDLEVEILLEGTPRSYLGLGAAEQPRVFVYLNHLPLNLYDFTVETTTSSGLPDWFADVDLSKPGRFPTNSRPVIYRPGDRVELWGTAFVEKISLSAQAGKSSSGSAGRRATLALDRGGVRKSPLLNVSSLQSTGLPWKGVEKDQIERNLRRVVSISSSLGGTFRIDRGFGRGIAAGETGKLPLNWTEPIGPKLTRGEKDRLIEGALPGLVLRRRLPISSLVEGVNTLVVSIVSGRKIRGKPVEVSQAVTFVVLPPEKPEHGDATKPSRKPFSHLSPPLDLLFRADLPLRGEVDNKCRGASGSLQKDPDLGGWLAPRQRKHLIEETLKVLLPQMKDATRLVEEVTGSISHGRLRPHIHQSAGEPLQKKPVKR